MGSHHPRFLTAHLLQKANISLPDGQPGGQRVFILVLVKLSLCGTLMQTGFLIFQFSILLKMKLRYSCSLSCWNGFLFPSQL